jgi:DNA primase
MTLDELVRSVLDVRETSQEGEVNVCCPFCVYRGHAEDTKYRLGINTETGVAHCYQCEYIASRFNKNRKRKLFGDICRQLGLQTEEMTDKEVSIQKLETMSKKKEDVEVVLPEEYEPLWENVNDAIGKEALAYVLARGVTEEQIKKHKIGFCAVGKYSYRIIFPIYMFSKKTSQVKLNGLVTRTFYKDATGPKYLNSNGNKNIFNLKSPIKRKKIGVLCEGVFDALAVERSVDYVDALARLGSSLTSIQLHRLKSYKEIVVWPDPDEPGIEGANKVIRQIVDYNLNAKISFVMPLEDDEDLGKLGETMDGCLEIARRLRKRALWTEALGDLALSRVLFAR